MTSPEKVIRWLLDEEGSPNELEGLSARAANVVLGLVGEYVGERPTKEGGWPAALRKLADMNAESILHTRNIGTKFYLEIRNWLASHHGIRWPDPQELITVPTKRDNPFHHRKAFKAHTIGDLKKITQSDAAFGAGI